MNDDSKSLVSKTQSTEVSAIERHVRSKAPVGMRQFCLEASRHRSNARAKRAGCAETELVKPCLHWPSTTIDSTGGSKTINP